MIAVPCFDRPPSEAELADHQPTLDELAELQAVSDLTWDGDDDAADVEALWDIGGGMREDEQ